MSDRTNDHAIVLGGSIAGLLAARVLAEAYPQVTVLDRDELAPGSQPRRGAPQGRAHPRAARPRPAGARATVPGPDHRARGSRRAYRRRTRPGALLFGGHRLARAEAGLVAVSVSRPLLEDRIRARVRALPGVRFAPAADAVGLRSSPDRRRVTGGPAAATGRRQCRRGPPRRPGRGRHRTGLTGPGVAGGAGVRPAHRGTGTGRRRLRHPPLRATFALGPRRKQRH